MGSNTGKAINSIFFLPLFLFNAFSTNLITLPSLSCGFLDCILNTHQEVHLGMRFCTWGIGSNCSYTFHVERRDLSLFVCCHLEQKCWGSKHRKREKLACPPGLLGRSKSRTHQLDLENIINPISREDRNLILAALTTRDHKCWIFKWKFWWHLL